MTRSRITFFIVLAFVLAIAALSMTMSLISTGAILQIYIATAVFGIGVVALDFLGILGEHGEDGGDASIALDSGDGAIDFDGGADFDGSVDGGIEVADGPGVHIGGTEFDMGDSTQGHVDSQFTDFNKSAGSWVLNIMAYLRLTVYFCMGFGPTGLMATSLGRNPLASLGIASVVGIISLFLAQAFFRLQQSVTDSTVHAVDMLRQEATVMIPVGHQDMGKVRITVGMSVTEQYALADDPDSSFKSGDTVRITRVTDECVYVS